MQKLEGSVTFHTAMSTAFPQPAPGMAKGPGPMKVPDEKLRSVLGITDVKAVMKNHSLAVVDSTLAPAGAAGPAGGGAACSCPPNKHAPPRGPARPLPL